MTAVPMMIAATSTTPQRISQSTGPRQIGAATGCDPLALVRDILAHMLETNFRISQLSVGYAYNAQMAYPLGNPVT